ncbi:unnamed protein product [Mesocestoides corti]|uniref:Protein kinase domain-containing protein n=1 Tax=Mesocestoides corti TaxID=53468 RepID=A0A0R3UCT5_MESCO|nr:unnamed protein product [Mesocestoides corti]
MPRNLSAARLRTMGSLAVVLMPTAPTEVRRVERSRRRFWNCQVVPDSGQNYGFDDDQGSYIHTPHDYVAYRFEVLKILGKGSFGQVVEAFDQMTRTLVGLKMVRNESRFTKQAAEEICTSELLRDQDLDNSRNVVHFRKHFTFREHVCMTFELLNMNIYELIKQNKFQGFPLPLVR